MHSIGDPTCKEMTHVASPQYPERRAVLRKACAFDVRLASKTGILTGIGFEVSQRGITFSIPKPAGAEQLTIEAVIRGQSIPLTVRVMRAEPMWFRNSTWNKLACVIESPPPQWVSAVEATPGGIRTSSHERTSPRPRSAARETTSHAAAPTVHEAPFGSLPKSVQHVIVRQLQDLKRIDPPRSGKPPLLKMTVGEQYRDGATGAFVRRYHVRSKVDFHGHMRAYDTIFLITDQGHVVRAE